MKMVPCARLMKFISPDTTDRPTDNRNSSIASCSPFSTCRSTPRYSLKPSLRGAQRRNCSPNAGTVPVEAPTSVLVTRLQLAAVGRVLDVGDGRQHGVVELVAGLAHLEEVHRLDDVVGLRVDAQRPAR